MGVMSARVSIRAQRSPARTLCVFLLALATVFAAGCSSPSAATGVSTAPRRTMVALTFDDGPDPAITPIVLDVLKAHGVKATFFVTGENASAHPDLIRRAVAEGHVIGNHGYGNDALNKLPYDKAFKELLGTEQIVSSITGHAPRFVRYPLGLESPALQRATRDLGMTGTVAWHYSQADVGEDDWRCKGVEKTLRFAQDASVDGAILLAHDANEVTRCAGQIVWLDRYLDWARGHGVTFGLLATADGPNALNGDSWVTVVPPDRGQHWKD